ncbi:MAG: transcriptional regulator [Microcystis novacekii Mn_MB_F_20050700_S1]|uniref:Transcriptional regulator n=1 Tax=Microcystis novacekii Mn_MB_F_20050700_S1D TaxID=2486266 RepID=A0A552IXA4_9CHRO|nr:MAG: transcriptional regulator [Microcystis novacekii Mn_MB_F_20050700_S1D]TRU91194.1 MAG: transcriptional regulator [Microcystis novacekii Mn_MB_F_20050700_S1]
MEAHQPNNIGKIIGGVLMAKSRSYQDDLFKALQDTEEARAYLNAALEDGNAQVFILALQDVLNAKINKMQLSEANVDNIDQILPEIHNLGLANLKTLLEKLGYRLVIEPEKIKL